MLRLMVRIFTRKTIIILLIAIASLITALVIINWRNLLSNLGLVISIIALLIPAAGICVKYPRFYMYLVYLKAVIFGVDTLWHLSARYQGIVTTNTFKQLCSELENMSKNISVHSETNYMYKATLDGINICMTIRDLENPDLESDEDFIQHVHFQVTDFRAPYENTMKLLEEDIEPYLQKIYKTIKPNKTDFELTINFFEGNPWAKAITKGIKFDDILSLDFKVKIDNNKHSKGEVQYSKNDLRVYCSELSDLSKLIKKRLLITS